MKMCSLFKIMQFLNTMYQVYDDTKLTTTVMI